MGRSGEGALTGGAECAAIAIGNKWIDKGGWLEKVQREEWVRARRVGALGGQRREQR